MNKLWTCHNHNEVKIHTWSFRFELGIAFLVLRPLWFTFPTFRDDNESLIMLTSQWFINKKSKDTRIKYTFLNVIIKTHNNNNQLIIWINYQLAITIRRWKYVHDVLGSSWVSPFLFFCFDAFVIYLPMFREENETRCSYMGLRVRLGPPYINFRWNILYIDFIFLLNKEY